MYTALANAIRPHAPLWVALTCLTSVYFLALGTMASQAVDCLSLPPGTRFQVAGQSAVYLINANGERLYFPNSEVYHTWYADFSGIQKIASACTDNYPAPTSPPLGVNYRPGSRLVKITFSPAVYAVLPGNALAKIGSEEVARQLYGDNWSKLVRDIPDPYWVNYHNRGADLNFAQPHNGLLVRLAGRSAIYAVENNRIYPVAGSLPSILSADVREIDDSVFALVPAAGENLNPQALLADPTQRVESATPGTPGTATTTSPTVPSPTSTPVTSTTTPTTSTVAAPKVLPPPAPIQHFCGNNIKVPEETPYIQVAIDAACNSDSIIVSAGTYYENLKVEREGLTIKAAAGAKPETVIVDGSGKGTVVRVAQVKNFTIDGLTRRNAGQDNNPEGNTGLHIDARWRTDVLAKNLIIKDNGFGVVIWHADDRTVTLKNNLIINNRYDGIVNGNTSPARLDVINNTIANNGRYGYTDDKQESLQTNAVVLKNNIIADSGGAGIYVYESENRFFNYNNLWKNTGGSFVKFRGGVAGINTPFIPEGTINRALDPRFVSAADFHLQSSSPLINAGDPALKDPDGSRSDIGAYPF